MSCGHVQVVIRWHFRRLESQSELNYEFPSQTRYFQVGLISSALSSPVYIPTPFGRGVQAPFPNREWHPCVQPSLFWRNVDQTLAGGGNRIKWSYKPGVTACSHIRRSESSHNAFPPALRDDSKQGRAMGSWIKLISTRLYLFGLKTCILVKAETKLGSFASRSIRYSLPFILPSKRKRNIRVGPLLIGDT